MNKRNDNLSRATRRSSLGDVCRRIADSLLAASHFSRNVFSKSRDGRRVPWRLIWKNLLEVPTALIIVWLLLLYWGEARSFSSNIAACNWNKWEQWPTNAKPHHLVFVTDPQLIDPHTYPERPWPLSIITYAHTDMYLRRAYSRIQRINDPDTIIFLGDLFDGGREWSTATSTSPEIQYREYGELFWIEEFKRFHNIFMREWDSSREARAPPRRIIASLPGNHDIGFGVGIQKEVRDRFNAYFGDSNRIDIIANHTFISLDTPSLSAMNQPEGAETIWKPTEDFLADIKAKKVEAVERHLTQIEKNASNAQKLDHAVETLPGSPLTESDDEVRQSLDRHQHQRRSLTASTSASASADNLPTILLTHVPLYRAQGTPCGPLRERYPPYPPPPGQKVPVFPDDRNSIRVAGGFGYQYQNVLTEQLTQHIINRLHGQVSHAFSGDDHDYCEVIHTKYDSPSATHGLCEITVKSINWAMGVRKPGFLLVSLWNEVDEKGRGIHATQEATLQTHLCLLPDQIGTFIYYGIMFGISIVALFLNAVLSASKPAITDISNEIDRSNSAPLLPTFSSRNRAMSSAEREKSLNSTPSDNDRSSTASSSFPANDLNLSSRSSYPYMPSAGAARAWPPRGNDDDYNDEEWRAGNGYSKHWKASRGRTTKWKRWVVRVLMGWGVGIARVGVVAGGWYVILLFIS